MQRMMQHTMQHTICNHAPYNADNVTYNAIYNMQPCIIQCRPCNIQCSIQYATCNMRRCSAADVAPSRCCTVALQPPPGRRPSGSTRDSRGRSALRRAAADIAGVSPFTHVCRCGWVAYLLALVDAAGVGPVPAQLWAGESPFSPGADVGLRSGSRFRILGWIVECTECAAAVSAWAAARGVLTYANADSKRRSRVLKGSHG